MTATEYYNKYVECFDMAEYQYESGNYECANYWYSQANIWFAQYEYAAGYKYDDFDYWYY